MPDVERGHVPNDAVKDRGRFGGLLFTTAACVLTLATMGRSTILLVVALVISYAIWSGRGAWPPSQRVIPPYLVAVVVQGLHLVEEYQTGFPRLFPPVFGAEPWTSRQFLIFNVVWLAIFLLAGLAMMRRAGIAYLVALFLAIGGGIGNGLGHAALVARTGGYFPGAYTGMLSLVAGVMLLTRLLGRPELPNDPAGSSGT